MKKSLLKELKNKLKTEKIRLEEELKKITEVGGKSKDKWILRFPKFNGGETGGGALEKNADEVEEYTTLLPIKYNLEHKLKEINSALEKIKKGNYGLCERCHEKIEEKLLKIYPETKFCRKCKSINLK